MTSSLSSLPSGRFRPPMIPCFSMLSFFFKFAVIPRSSSSPVIFALVFPFLFYPPFFLLLFLFEVSPLSLYVASSSVVSILLSLTRIFLLLPVFDMCSVQLISVLRHIFISKASNLVMSSFLRVHVSAQYKVALQISVFTILFLRHLHTPLGNSFLLEKASFSLLSRGANPGAEGRDPHILGRGSCGGRREGRSGVVGFVDGS